jgi:hypothetical protein
VPISRLRQSRGQYRLCRERRTSSKKDRRLESGKGGYFPVEALLSVVVIRLLRFARFTSFPGQRRNGAKFRAATATAAAVAKFGRHAGKD